jgi:anti-sigma regulatory factor (Ser/Thr protein kinase)
MSRSENVQLSATADAPAQARAVVSRTMGDDPRVELAALATSEVVTNAIVHGDAREREAIDLRIDRRDDGAVRIEVVNRGGTPFEDGDVEWPAAGELGGWGLGIVQSVCVDWGVDHADGRTAVWFLV